MTHRCSICDTNWAAFMCSGGACPECATGTTRSHDALSPDAELRFKATMRARAAREASEHKHKLFDEFCARRDAERAAVLRGLALEAAGEEVQHGEAA